MQAADHGNRQSATAAEYVLHTRGAAKIGFQVASVKPPAFQMVFQRGYRVRRRDRVVLLFVSLDKQSHYIQMVSISSSGKGIKKPLNFCQGFSVICFCFQRAKIHSVTFFAGGLV